MSKYCPNCGKQLPDEALFCDNCGIRMPDMNMPSTKTNGPSLTRKTERAVKKKGSFFGGLIKLVLTAAILFGLFMGGMWLWNKWHYNPALDGDVYPGNSEPGEVLLIPDDDKSEQKTDDTPSIPDTPSSANTDPVIGNDSFDFDDVSKLNYEYFDEFYGQLMYEGLPEDRVPEPLKQANGVWKYNIKIRNDSSSGSLFDEIGYAEMSVNGSSDPPITIILHPRYASDGIEIWPETDGEVGYEPYSGGFDENENIKLIGNNCVLQPEYFYAYEGREYLYGKLWMSEESFGDFMMIRGQE